MHTTENITDVLRYWNLTGLSVTPNHAIPISTWDIGGQYILKKQTNTGDLQRSFQLSTLLATEGIPVATYVKSSNGQITTPDGLYCLMHKLPGHHADLYTQPELAFILGCELARLHVALLQVESMVTVCHDNNLIDEWHDYIKPGINGFVSNDNVNRIEILFLKLYPKLPRQFIHRDVHLHNILFQDGQVSGWLDFDISQKDVRLFDLVYAVSSIQPDDPERTHQWHTIRNDVIAGYNKINPLTTDENKALPVLMIVNALLFVAFWGYKNVIDKQNKAVADVERLLNEYVI